MSRLEEGQKRLVEIIDATPTWVECVPALVVMIMEGSAETRTNGMQELMKMARCADAYRAMVGSDAPASNE
jgi:hypothetical protein